MFAGKITVYRSLAGILVGMKPLNPITCDYEIYLFAKNASVVSGVVILCEHIGWLEPERLLQPLLSLPESSKSMEIKDYQV